MTTINNSYAIHCITILRYMCGSLYIISDRYTDTVASSQNVSNNTHESVIGCNVLYILRYTVIVIACCIPM